MRPEAEYITKAQTRALIWRALRTGLTGVDIARYLGRHTQSVRGWKWGEHRMTRVDAARLKAGLEAELIEKRPRRASGEARGGDAL